MSEENVEIVRRLYLTGAFDRFEVQALLAPDCELVNASDAIESGVRRQADIAEAFRHLADAFDVREHRLKRLFAAGDSVVADVTFYGRGTASGAELKQAEAHTWTFGDGKVVRFEWGRDLTAALNAVGLEE
jgi:ketosteroid isomerase-like protein